MFYSTIARYTVAVASSYEEVSIHERENAVVVETLCSDRDDAGFISIGITDLGLSPDLLIEGTYSPGPEAGFHPGLLIIPETSIAFIGVGDKILVFALAPIQKLADEETACGFWYWHRYDDFIIMCAELEFAVWDIYGKKIWSRFVEPPWEYGIDGDVVTLNIMGGICKVSLKTGDDLP